MKNELFFISNEIVLFISNMYSFIGGGDVNILERITH